MNESLHQVLVDEGFSTRFLKSAAGRNHLIRKSILWNIGTTSWYRCTFCKDHYVRVSELPDEITDGETDDLRSLENSAQTHGFCSYGCLKEMAEGLGDDVSLSLMLRASRIALRPDFYQSREWRTVRYEALKEHGAVCQCCGAKPPPPLHVDHIKSRITNPYLALHVGNLQVLCEDCNKGKGWKDDTDWRPAA